MAYYPWPATERAMKVQEVILKAMEAQLRWIQAAEILGMSAGTIRPWKQRYARQGCDGRFDRRRVAAR
jgi:transposase